jgi:hypothetical protein
MESNLEIKMMKSITDIVELKASLMAKENEFYNLIEENEMLKTRMLKKETKRV